LEKENKEMGELALDILATVHVCKRDYHSKLNKEYCSL